MSITVTWPLSVGQVQCSSILSDRVTGAYLFQPLGAASNVLQERRCMLVEGHSGRHASNAGDNSVITWTG